VGLVFVLLPCQSCVTQKLLIYSVMTRRSNIQLRAGAGRRSVKSGFRKHISGLDRKWTVVVTYPTLPAVMEHSWRSSKLLTLLIGLTLISARAAAVHFDINATDFNQTEFAVSSFVETNSELEIRRY
jgi:hypothetical protein